MRKIAIIGSGIAGLLAAHGLRKAGYEVTSYSDRTPEDFLLRAKPTGTAARFDMAVQYDRDLGLAFWDEVAPKIVGGSITFCPDRGNRLLTLTGRLRAPGFALDVRMMSARFLTELEARGGRVVYEAVSLTRLDEIAAENDLTIVAAGRAELCKLFERDAARSVYSSPQRKLGLVITRGGKMGFDGVPFLPAKFNLFQPYGEAFWVPYHHKDHGPTWNLLFEAKPGGPLDRFDGVKSGEETLAVAKRIIRDVIPWDYEWVKDQELADPHAWIVGTVTPTVRKPVAKLPSGRIVTALGDTAVSLDPIGGQGANSGTKMAKNLVECVVRHGDKPFDEAFVTDTFERFWARHGRPIYTFNNLLLEPIPPAARDLLIAQMGSDGVRTDGPQKVADAFLETFNDPLEMLPAMTDTRLAHALVERLTGKPWMAAAARGGLKIGIGQVRQKLGLPPGSTGA